MALLASTLACVLAPDPSWAEAAPPEAEEAEAEAPLPEEELIDEAALEGAFDFESLEDVGLMDEFALLVQEDVVVSASRRAQRIDDSPSAITVLTREELLASPFDTIADVLRMVPGMDVFLLTVGFPAPGTRSGSSRSAANVLVLVDGRDIIDPLFHFPLLLGLPIDLESIERVEIIRGPASTLYGAGALQGVINFVTRRASEEPLRVEADVSGNGPNTVAAGLRLSGTSGRFSWWASVGMDRAAPYHDASELGLSKVAGRTWARYEGVAFEGTLELGGALQEGSMVTFAGNGAGEFDEVYLRAEAIVKETRLHFLAEHISADLHLDLQLLFPGDDSMVLGRLPDPMSSSTWLYELAAERSWRFGENLRLMSGLQGKIIRHQPRVLVTCPESAPTAFDPEACELDEVVEVRPEAFAQLEWRVRPDLDLNLGVRGGFNTVVVEPGFAPRLTAVYRPAQNHTLRASVARAYRKPSYFELRAHVLLEPGTLQDEDLFRRVQHIFATGVGNEDLRNTKVDNLELGWRARFLEEALRLEVELYASRYLDDVRVDSSRLADIEYFAGLPIIGDSVGLQYINLEEQIWSAGAEVAATWKTPAEGLELSLAYVFDHVLVRSQAADGTVTFEKAMREPEHRIIAGAQYIHRSLRLSASAIWASAYRDNHAAPESIIAPPVSISLGANTLLAGRAGWVFGLGGSEWEAGLTGLMPVLGLELRETAGGYQDDGSNYGGEPIRPRLQGYLRAAF
ncbi:MAG: TonB-dependent receptor [Deltaproteobacteria bacterium]|nr:TonB-dependent receptor [Deltaproteobacteria bacterium]